MTTKGKWICCGFNGKRFGALPIPGVYAIYADGKLAYIGKSVNVRKRLCEHGIRGNKGRCLFGTFEIGLKVKYSKRYGDWAMWELRLLRRLKPSLNKFFN